MRLATYAATLEEMVEHVLDVEAPIRKDLLERRIANAHGWMRTGQRIRKQIEGHLKHVGRTKETSGTFLWNDKDIPLFVSFRQPKSEDDHRNVGEISVAELCGYLKVRSNFLGEEDPELTVARSIGVARLTESSRERIAEAIDVFKTQILVSS